MTAHAPSARYRLAVDTGGTFTDFVLLDERSGQLRVFKVPSTPDDPGRAVLDGVGRILAEAVAPASIDFFVHGTTVGTNALLEEKGARAGLVITQGFRGVYEVQEQAREYGPVLFDLMFERPRMLVPQSRTFEVAERVGSRGEVDLPLDDASVDSALRGLVREQVESVAICLLFSFANPDHERRVADAIKRRHPEWLVTASSDLLPQIREYYRLSTTVINAYIAPRLATYLNRLARGLRRAGVVTPRTYVMQSNGGTATFPSAEERGVATILSGPAGGVVAGVQVAALAGFANAITFDMGGTSCDVALAEGGQPKLTTRSTVGGRHLAMPALDIHTVSAGGGTLTWVDELGSLHAGPQSAGAHPGPVAYARGGEVPTVTDCDLVLGYLNPEHFLAGEMRLDVQAARDAIQERIAGPLGLGLYRAADGVVELVNVKMAEAIKAISTERGYDLRQFALVAFGGAGPVHATRIALDLGIPSVVVPPNPGVTSALGLLMCQVRHDYVVSRLRPLQECSSEDIAAAFAPLQGLALAELEQEGFSESRRRFEYLIDLRYAGQGYEISVPVDGPIMSPDDIQAVRRRFDHIHEQLYGHAAPNQAVEVVNYRVAGVGQVAPARLAEVDPDEGRPDRALTGYRPVYFGDAAPEPRPCRVYDRAAFGAGARVVGPAIVEQYDSTIVVHPGQELRVDAHGSAIIERVHPVTPA